MKMCRWMILSLIGLLANGEDCCGKCLNNVPNYNYNPMDFNQCVENKYCCFHCADKNIGVPTVLPVAGTSFDGAKTTATTGSFIKIQWEKADMITFVSFAPNQAKSGIPLTTSSKATKNGQTFLICPQYPGTLYFRGFGTDICNSVSSEFAVTVVSGVDGSDCSGTSPTIPPVPTTTTSSPQTQCNLARGSIINGACVCASDWVGPPECAGQPVWKLLVTIGGGLAALCSITVSVRAFLASRKAKREMKEREASAAEAQKKVAVEMETMRISSTERQDSVANDAPYVQSVSIDQDGASTPEAPPSKEYTL